MAGQENTLGAPAEGFSQTITFAGRAGGDMPRMGAAGAQAARLGVMGGQQAGLQGGPGLAPIGENKTMALLGQIVETVAGPQLKKRRLQNYVTGMQAAAAGVAVQEIAEEQPWYSKIFGEADAVEGARVYTQQAKASELAVQIEEAMPELRSKGAEEANAYFTGLVEKSMTGDAGTDAYLMQSLSRVLPGVMKKHAREHYIYQQEQATAAESTMFHSGAKLLQSATADLAAGKIDQAEFDQKQGEFAQLLAPPLGRNVESWQKRTAGDLALLAERGQFHAINAAVKAGVMEALSPDLQLKVENAWQAGEVTTRARDAEEWAPAMARIGMAARNPKPGTTVESLLKDIEAVNAEYKLRTGNRLPIYSAAKAEGSLEQLSASIEREIEKQAREAERRAAAARAAGDAAGAQQMVAAQLDTLWASGQINNASDLGVPKGQEDIYVMRRASTVLGQAEPGQLNPEQQRTMTLLALNAGEGRPANRLVADGIKAKLSAATAAGDSGAIRSLYADWKNISAVNPSAAEAYYGNDAHKRMLRFDMIYGGNPQNLPAAYTAAFGPSAQLEPKKMGKAEVTTFTSQLVDEVKKRRPELFAFGTGLEPGQLETLAGAVQTRAEAFAGVTDGKQSTALALSNSMRNGLQMFGGYVWQDRPGFDVARVLQSKVPKTSLVGGDVSDTEVSRATLAKDFNVHVKKALAAAGHKGEPVKLLGDGENGLVATWAVDGQFKSAAMSYTELATAIQKDQLARRPAKPGTIKESKGGFGPTWAPIDPNAKSIYGR